MLISGHIMILFLLQMKPNLELKLVLMVLNKLLV